MGLESLIIFLIVGGVAGWLAGVIGAFIGSWLFGRLGLFVGGGYIGLLIGATVGAVVLLFLIRLIRRAA